MSLPFRRADFRRTCVGVVVVRRCFGVNGSIFPSGMGKDRRAREGRWVSCNCHALNRFGRRFISSTPKKGQQTATMHCQPGARVVTLPTAGMGERALRCARARVVFFWRRHSVSGIRCGAWRPGLFVINQTKPPFTTHKHKHRTKSNQVLAMAMLSRRALRRRLRFRTDRRALGRDARDCGAPASRRWCCSLSLLSSSSSLPSIILVSSTPTWETVEKTQRMFLCSCRCCVCRRCLSSSSSSLMCQWDAMQLWNK